jgi:hypothetical protein
MNQQMKQLSKEYLNQNKTGIIETKGEANI